MNSSRGPLALRATVAAYRLSLALYPSEFRARFGDDLVEAFGDDMEASYALRGLRGLLLQLPGLPAIS